MLRDALALCTGALIQPAVANAIWGDPIMAVLCAMAALIVGGMAFAEAN